MSTSTPTPPLADFVAALNGMFDHYRRLCRDLSDEQLATQSLCPAWSARDVIAHVIGVEAVLDGWEPSLDAMPPFDRLAGYQTDAAALDRDGFTTMIDATIDSRLANLAALGAEHAALLDMPSITPAGPATYGRFLQIRLFDLWVHALDIAVPLGLTAAFPTGFAAERSVDEVQAAMGYIVGKKIGMTEGMSIVFHLTPTATGTSTTAPGVERDIAVAVEGRAHVVDAIATPTTALTMDAQTFVLLAAGRIDPQASIDAGTATWTGDSEWGERAARNLAYTR
ncbi:MAG TPA: maleylpyruvate isomerase N-terminal domain-containing protein [Ilumatobacteraceae bacterium]|nr:maleylpyruvate isomerase N-terminal domain-containing protein [Ilumatobacteraceae bacterium]